MKTESSTMVRYEDVPAQVNIAEFFLDGVPAGRTALLTGDGAVSYGRLRECAARAGHVLRGLGVGRGDRVLLALGDGLEFVAVWYGAQRIGAVTAEVYTYLQPKDYRYYAEYTRPAVVIADSRTLPPLRAAGVPNLLVVGVPADQLWPGEHHYETLAARQPAALDSVPLGRDEPAIWKFTTGSTGAPKACVIAARSPVLSFDWFARQVLDLRPDDVLLPVPKLFFGYARDLAALFPMGVGAASVVFPERSTADRVFELIERYRPTVLVNVPTMMNAMVSHPDAGRRDLSCLRMCISAGEALPEELHRRWLDTFGVEVVDGIGSSEVYHMYLSNRPGHVRAGSLGQAVPGYRVRVVGPGGEPLPDGETGLLQITGETVALGYWGAPDKSAEVFVAPHTVRSQDLFTRDSEGFFHYKGRADDLLKVGGRWVAPTEIENCLLTHPQVQQAAVVGYQRDGLTVPRAYIVPAPHSVPDLTELQQYVRDRLAPHKYPRDIQLLDALPHTANGKIDRQALRDLRRRQAGGAGISSSSNPNHVR